MHLLQSDGVHHPDELGALLRLLRVAETLNSVPLLLHRHHLATDQRLEGVVATNVEAERLEERLLSLRGRREPKVDLPSEETHGRLEFEAAVGLDGWATMS